MTFQWTDLLALGPELTVALGAVLVLMLEVFLPPKGRRAISAVSALVVLLALVVTFSSWTSSIPARSLFGGMLTRDAYSLFLGGVVLLAALLSILLSAGYVEREGIEYGEYYGLLLFAVLGMMLVAGATELLTLFISYEILSLAVYVLSGIARGRAESAEASLKYFLLGAFASAFLVYGIALIYGATGSTRLEVIAGSIAGLGAFESGLLLAGAALLLIGFAFKVAVVPFHAWVPDVYHGAPLPVTAFMSVGVKAAAFAALARVLFTGLADLSGAWQPVLWVLAVLTMILGNTAALGQTNIKRMLAYSSIAHAGYMLVALSAFAAGEMALGSILFYALVYTVMNLGAFAVVLMVGREREESQDLAHYYGLATSHPWLAAAMALFMFSLAGLPPTAGFLGKFYLLNAALRAGQVGLAVVLVLASLVSWYYYLRIVWFMYMESAKHGPAVISRAASLGVAVAGAAALVILLGILPSLAMNLAQAAAASLAGGLPRIGGL